MRPIRITNEPSYRIQNNTDEYTQHRHASTDEYLPH